MKCFVCNVDTSKRCGRCKKVLFCSTICQRQGWTTHKQQCTREETDVAPSSVSLRPNDENKLLSEAQLESLHRQGWCVIKLPDDVTFSRSKFLDVWTSFFRSPVAYKNTFRTPSLKGSYMTPHPGLHEVFEHKQV
jgi:hypothetical protein